MKTLNLICLFVVLLALCAFGVFAQELVTLTAPEAHPSNTGYHVERLTLDFDAGLIYINLKGVNGEARTCTYSAGTTPTGAFLNDGLNRANLSSAYAGNATTGSLKQRIQHRLVVMNEAPAVCGVALTGTLTGAVP